MGKWPSEFASCRNLAGVNGELAETIALATHGSAWLAGLLPDDALALERGNSTFQYVQSVSFLFEDTAEDAICARPPGKAIMAASFFEGMYWEVAVRVQLAPSSKRRQPGHLL
jgi:hypothetical protein